MIMADKIIRLRKKNGWSQEELAERVGVSRQAVSKWEGAQTVPELEKLLQLADLFGVTTDYLLKDTVEDEGFTDGAPSPGVKKLSLEAANAYLAVRRRAAVILSAAVFLCIFSPIPLMFLGAGAEYGALTISENMAGTVGMIILLAIITAAVAMFVYCGFMSAPYKFLDDEPFETEYGVVGMVTERQRAYNSTYIIQNIIAACICVISPVPLMLGGVANDDFTCALLLFATMIIAGLGASLFVFSGVKQASMRRILRQGDFSPETKKQNKLKSAVILIYWLVLTAIFLIWSFSADAWDISWMVFAVGGVLFGAVCAVGNLLIGRSSERKEKDE